MILLLNDYVILIMLSRVHLPEEGYVLFCFMFTPNKFKKWSHPGYCLFVKDEYTAFGVWIESQTHSAEISSRNLECTTSNIKFFAHIFCTCFRWLITWSTILSLMCYLNVWVLISPFSTAGTPRDSC